VTGGRRPLALGIAVLLGAALVAGPRCGEPRAAGDDATDAQAASAAANAMIFPPGFLLGAATAGFQVEMGCPTLPHAECVDPNSDWYQFVTSPAIAKDRLAFVSGEDPAVVCPGQWELYASDFDLAAGDGHNAVRMGIEWSRIFPRSTGGIEGYEALRAAADAKALAHYHDVFAALKARGLTPLVTLNHYTLPTWIHDGVGCHRHPRRCAPRGWLDREVTVREIAKYAGFIAREYGGEVDLWATLNEPFAVVLPGYLLPSYARSNPPALLLRSRDAKAVLAAMIEGHARMADAVRENDRADADGDGVAQRVGLVYAMSPVAPKDPAREADRTAAANLFYLWNAVFLNAVTKGDFDGDLTGRPAYRADLAGRLDYVGLNYYTRVTVEGLPFAVLPGLSPLFTANPASISTQEVYPRGIYEMAAWVRDHLGLPVIVTENNSRYDPHDDDATEQRYLVEHLTWLWRAIRDGVDVRGYFYWALIDNYEWNQGPAGTGLYEVGPYDPAKTRHPRGVAAVYRSIAIAHGVPADLAAKYPVDRR
jgi:beta-glucosidase/6-phospho-beta-glucosidase/beta-galactosidase